MTLAFDSKVISVTSSTHHKHYLFIKEEFELLARYLDRRLLSFSLSFKVTFFTEGVHICHSPRARNRFNQVVEAKRFEGVFL